MNSVIDSKQDQPDGAAEQIGLLRRFHYGEPGAAASTVPPGDGILPALLNPYRDASAIRYQYPLYLAPPGGEGDLARPLSEFFAQAVEAFALGADDARILRDNLPWIERFVRRKLDGPDPADAPTLYAEAAAALQEQLDLEPGSRDTLDADLGRLGGAIEEGSVLLGYGPDVSLYLLLQAVRHRCAPGREQLREKIDRSIGKLQALLQVEKARSAGDADSAGPGSKHFDTDALSGMLETRARGSVEMSAARRERVEQALAVLEAWQDDPVLVRFVGKVSNPAFGQLADVEVVDSDTPCSTAGELFARDAAAFARLFAAIRIAALEAEDNYDPAVHFRSYRLDRARFRGARLGRLPGR